MQFNSKCTGAPLRCLFWQESIITFFSLDNFFLNRTKWFLVSLAIKPRKPEFQENSGRRETPQRSWELFHSFRRIFPQKNAISRNYFPNSGHFDANFRFRRKHRNRKKKKDSIITFFSFDNFFLNRTK